MQGTTCNAPVSVVTLDTTTGANAMTAPVNGLYTVCLSPFQSAPFFAQTIPRKIYVDSMFLL